MNDQPISNLQQGQEIVFNAFSFTENEIIDFATTYDPLPFHLDAAYAQKSRFGGLIASGPHPFNYVYKNQWIPLFGGTVVCGLELNNWRFLKPIYSNELIVCKVLVQNLEPNREKALCAVTWGFTFENKNKETYQHLSMKVLHTL